MSSQNTFPGQGRGRPSARPAQQESQQRQPSWVNPQAHAQAQIQAEAEAQAAAQPGSAWPPQSGQSYEDDFAPSSGYGYAPRQHEQQAAQPTSNYGHWAELQSGHGSQEGAPLSDPYAPQFEPYTPVDNGAYNGQPAPNYGHQAPQWPQGGADPRGFDANSYGAPASPQRPGYPAASYGEQQYQDAELSASDWAGQPGGFGTDPYQQPGQGRALGFAQAEGGDLDAAYGEDEGEYEDEEEAPRSRWPLKIFAALAGAIVIGGGMAYGYKKMAVTEFQGDPPIIKSEAFPAKTKPADAGGKMFPYSDTKIMGRLGDGTSGPGNAAPASETPQDGAQHSESAHDASPDTASAAADDSGPRKVSTLVVGRDGSIQPPPAAMNESGGGSEVAVPGTALVDAFGQSGNAHANNSGPSAARKSVTPVTIAKVNSGSPVKASAGSIDDQNEAIAPKKSKALKKVARAESGTATDAYSDASGPPITAASSGTNSGTAAAHSGFVAVLASIPRSSSSRLDALKRFADMQQKYSSALSGKTPDVLSATVSKGKYDRLVVGPPGSRSEASGVCTQLKSAGYSDCWVTSY